MKKLAVLFCTVALSSLAFSGPNDPSSLTVGAPSAPPPGYDEPSAPAIPPFNPSAPPKESSPLVKKDRQTRSTKKDQENQQEEYNYYCCVTTGPYRYAQQPCFALIDCGTLTCRATLDTVMAPCWALTGACVCASDLCCNCQPPDKAYNTMKEGQAAILCCGTRESLYKLNVKKCCCCKLKQME